MRIKKYVGTSIQDAMVQIKNDLGRDAVILHTRKIRVGGIFGLFKREKIEVTAAVDDAAAAVPAGPAPQSGTAAEGPDRPENSGLVQLQGEIAQLREMMGEMAARLNEVKLATSLPYPKPYSDFYERLLAADVSEQITADVIQNLYTWAQAENITDKNEMQTYLCRHIAELISAPKSIQLDNTKTQAVIALVGPTGVGKTTTIAKLAANYTLLAKQKVALVTADTYRIAAVEQLKTYGEIIGVQVEVVFTPPELKAAMEKNRNKDLVLLDTAGRSHRNNMQMSELKSFINAAAPDEVYLVLSVTTKMKDIQDIIKTYEDVGFTKLIFTKLDESACHGAILNAAVLTGKSLSYVTVGQNVPDDIEVANPEKIAKMIVG